MTMIWHTTLPKAPWFLIACALSLPAYAAPKSAESIDEKIYVAVEDESRIAVFGSGGGPLLGNIDLSIERHGARIALAPHNVQVAPDGKTVWVTANRAHAEEQHGIQSEHSGEHLGSRPHSGDTGHEMTTGMASMPVDDEVIVIDPASDKIVHRIPVGSGVHLAHVVVTPDGSAAYVSAQNESVIYRIDARNYRIEQTIRIPSGKQPHGLRMAPDGTRAYIALLAGKGLGILDLQSHLLKIIPLDGTAVQTAVTPDGKFVLATLYDTKKLAVYDPDTKKLRYLDLPASAQGPVQLYPAPDSRTVYVADQGHYFGKPDGNLIFKADLQQFRITESIKAGTAPHGIVVAKHGRHAYVTNLVSNDMSVIDLRSNLEIARLPTGRKPNGVSIWNRWSGGTP